MTSARFQRMNHINFTTAPCHGHFNIVVYTNVNTCSSHMVGHEGEHGIHHTRVHGGGCLHVQVQRHAPQLNTLLLDDRCIAGGLRGGGTCGSESRCMCRLVEGAHGGAPVPGCAETLAHNMGCHPPDPTLNDASLLETTLWQTQCPRDARQAWKHSRVLWHRVPAAPMPASSQSTRSPSTTGSGAAAAE